MDTKILLILAVLVVAILVFLGVNPTTEDFVPTKVTVSGEVDTVGFSTDPFKIEFREMSSDQTKTVILTDEEQYSTSLSTGKYQVKIFYTTFGDITALDCDAGTHEIDSDSKNLNFKC